MSATTTATAPSIWAGCESCYSSGRLVGVWIDAVDAADITAEEIHADSGVDPVAEACEEFVCMDTSGLPTTGEPSLDEAARWGEIYEEVGPDHWPAYCAWVRSGSHVEDGDGMPSVADFTEALCGHWDSFQSYADSLAEDCGLLRDIPEELVSYVDLSRWASDIESDYTVVDAPGGGVYIFRNM